MCIFIYIYNNIYIYNYIYPWACSNPEIILFLVDIFPGNILIPLTQWNTLTIVESSQWFASLYYTECAIHCIFSYLSNYDKTIYEINPPVVIRNSTSSILHSNIIFLTIQWPPTHIVIFQTSEEGHWPFLEGQTLHPGEINTCCASLWLLP